MGTIKDITGKRFGRLIVVEMTDKKGIDGSIVWKCKCDCGNFFETNGSYLRNGHTTSCGCITKENLRKYSDNKILDLKGKKFGRLTPIRITEEKKLTCYVWECLCDCGNIVFVPANSLVSGNTTSCGCVQKEKALMSIEKANEDCVEQTKFACLNLPKRKNTTSNIKGVFWSSQKKKWQAKIKLKGKTYHLGFFDDLNKAGEARKKAEHELFEPILNKYGKELKGDD